MAATAMAGEFRLTPGISVDQSFTDNARQTSPGRREADMYTRVQPNVNLSGTGGRLKFNLSYGFNEVRYLDNGDLDNRSHNLAHSGNAELLRDMLFVDTRASISEALIANTGSQSGLLDTTNPSNRTTVTSFSVAPYLRNQLGSYASTEYRYNFSFTDSSGLSRSLVHQLVATIRSGPEFQRLNWALNANVQHADRSNSPGTGGTLLLAGQDSSSDVRAFSVDPSYRVTDTFTLTSSIGYQETIDPTLGSNVSGETYSLGFRYTPSPRTSLSASYNHRDNNDFGSGSLSYKITERLSLDASYTETLQTSESQRARNLDFLTVDQFGNFVDARTAQAFQLNNNNFNLNDNVVRRQSGSVRLNLQSGRDTFGTDFTHEISTTDATGIAQTSYGFAGNWSRVISDVNRLNLTLRFRNTDQGTTPSRSDNTENVNASFSHNFTPTLSGVLTYSLIARQASGATPAAGTETAINTGSIVENLFTIGLRKTF